MWQAFGSTPVKLAGCDQTRFNTVLIESKLTWTPFDYNRNHYFSGTSQSKDITLIALPQEVVCRNECKANRLSSYYVYHPVTTQHASVKHQRLVARNVWKIDDHWKMTLDSIQSTMDWLNEVTVWHYNPIWRCLKCYIDNKKHMHWKIFAHNQCLKYVACRLPKNIMIYKINIKSEIIQGSTSLTTCARAKNHSH